MSEIEVLKAIESVRSELVKVSRQGDAVAIREVHERLISLYAALDVHNILIAIDRIDFKKAA